MTRNTEEQMSNSQDSGCGCLLSLMVLGLLGLIFVLPSYLSTSSHGHGQSEARTYVGSMNRGQQAYYLEKQYFSSAIDGLGLGLDVSTDNYSYGSTNPDTRTTLQTATENGVSEGGAGANTTARATRRGELGWNSYSYVYGNSLNQDAVRDYVGVAFIVSADANNEATTQALLCEEQELRGAATGFALVEAGGFEAGITQTNVGNVNCNNATYFTNANPVAQ